ncbi:MAG: 3-deoxy-D-manno-octulosonic acid transferase [Pyrinomonadaceae bacterium]|nr:3-deoxy-D-manno-octulosonic acid transferase [Pyrinomonadaceae bacterium]
MPVLSMYFIYSLLLALGFLILLPRFLFDAFRHGKYVAGFRERLGLLTPLQTNGRTVIWIHCVSVGETQAARPLVQSLKQRFPNHSIAVSTTTLTGQNVAREVFKNDVEKVFYFPFDWRWILRRTLTAVNPAAVLIMETELWPNFLRECEARRIPVAIVNGRLSEQSFRRYKLIKGFISRVLSSLSLAAVQTEADAQRLRALGLDAAKIFVAGNTKFDAGAASSTGTLTTEFRDRFKLGPAAPLIVAASTHAPEERIILNALKGVRLVSELQPRLMIAPRHPERFREVAALIQASGFPTTNRTAPTSPSDSACEVILLDSIGELPTVYSLASIVFVGGSIANAGGHNILEPAAVGASVITGAHTQNFKQIVETFVEAEAVIQLPPLSESEATIAMANAFEQLLLDPDKRSELGRRAFSLVNQNRGATERTLDLLSSILTRAPNAGSADERSTKPH